MLPDEPEMEDGGRRTLGVIDGTATQLALAALMLLPTALACIFWPRALGRMIPAIEPEGRRGICLAPGAFFLISVLTSLLLAATFLADSGGAMARVGTEIGSAASEGEVWQVAALLFPLFLGATSIGLFALVAGMLARVPDWSIVAAVRSGFYAVFTVGFGVTIAEPFSRLFGDGGANGVVEPVVAIVGGLMIAWFFGALLSQKAGWPRALTTGAITGIPVSLIVLAGYS
ncbi:hypothetical protein [Parvularcula lutaonensis]|uniref:Yip1 domain-containing protein n=1 Tax=Parvularcula lutaonensis TaxID=491923 RepID=A0ABV7MC10_9PROT|nr:hypothetical protein [Parvularcula lutaonensis]GGY45752.1 hypothetical protein GCM10007148_13480 [Parvularcula lutaonensis]